MTKPYFFIHFNINFLGKSGDFVDVVDNTEGHVADLTLDLDHVVQNQVGQHGQGVGTDLK